MTQQPDSNQPESPLGSAEYRERLLRKLNCLIAVLEVATKKVRRSLEADGSDVDRLRRIESNLQETMDVCMRARRALEKRATLPDDLRERLARVANEPELKHSKALLPAGLPPGSRVELGSDEEVARFRELGPIDKTSVESCDFDELARRLQD